MFLPSFRFLVAITGITAAISMVCVYLTLVQGRKPRYYTNQPYVESESRIERVPHVQTHCNISFTRQMDIMGKPPPNYLQQFKNPCWYSANGRLLCVPYFIVAGMAKCGTTDLFGKIGIHPDVIRPTLKEPRWFASARFYSSESIAAYAIRAFSSLSKLLSSPTERKTDYVTGEATVTNAEGPAFWELLPGNMGYSEPLITNAHIFRHLMPDVKIIFIVRDPVERLWSEYLAFSRAHEKSPAVFHNIVSNAIHMYAECLEKKSLRACMYNWTLFQLSTMNETETYAHPDGCNIVPQNIISIRRGAYHVFIRDFMDVFPSNQLLVLHTEDLSAEPVRVMQNVYKFFNLSPLKMTSEMKAALESQIRRNTRNPSDLKVPGMWPSTSSLLHTFYKQHNIQLAQLLENPKYRYGQ